jgi:transposase
MRNSTLNDYRINGYLHLIESLDSEIKIVSKEIVALAKEDEMASLLMTIPGIGYYSALLIVSEVGDINKFPIIQILYQLRFKIHD